MRVLRTLPSVLSAVLVTGIGCASDDEAPMDASLPDLSMVADAGLDMGLQGTGDAGEPDSGREVGPTLVDVVPPEGSNIRGVTVVLTFDRPIRGGALNGSLGGAARVLARTLSSDRRIASFRESAVAPSGDLRVDLGSITDDEGRPVEGSRFLSFQL